MGSLQVQPGAAPEGAGHPGRDTPDDRDRFLLQVLIDLGIRRHRAQRIVLTADHLSDGRFVAKSGSPSAIGSPESDKVPVAGVDLDGSHLAGPGFLVGLLGGLLTGWQR